MVIVCYMIMFAAAASNCHIIHRQCVHFPVLVYYLLFLYSNTFGFQTCAEEGAEEGI